VKLKPSKGPLSVTDARARVILTNERLGVSADIRGHKESTPN
jgi:hypothetical protein